MIRLLELLMKKPLKKNFFPKREGDVRKTCADVLAILMDIKFHSEVSFKDGFVETFKFFAENGRWQEY
jgi:UDP-glucose 4-epimerase